MGYRDLIFLELLEKLKNTNSIIIDRVCYSVSILVAIGISSYWPECIEDIIRYAKISKENCYLGLIILSNVVKELKELQITGKKIMRIKDCLIEKCSLVSEFAFLLLENFCATANNFHNQSESKFFNNILDLIQNWLKLNLNILKSTKIMAILFLCFNTDNSELICDIISEAISVSKNAKYYIINSEHDINILLQKIDEIEIQSISLIIDFIDVFVNENILEQTVSLDSPIRKLFEQYYNKGINSNNFNSKEKLFPNLKLTNGDKALVLSNLVNIMSSIFENFVFLVFTKNSLSGSLFRLFFYFVTHKNRKISAKMFMSFNELKEFINRGYKFRNFDHTEKKEFCDFLIKICENVMSNCKLTDIYIANLAAGKNINNVDDIEIFDASEFIYGNVNIDMDNDMQISEYRKQAEEIFYDIFMVFLTNFEEEGVTYFFMFLYNILDQAQINNISGLEYNHPKIYIVEVVLHVINSTINCFEVSENYSKFLIEFTEKIINSQVIQSEKLTCPFLKFMDVVCPYIHKKEKLYIQSIEIFTQILKVKQFENIASLILLQISEFADTPNQEHFNYLYNIFLTNYDNFTNYALGNFVELLANTIGIKDRDLDDNNDSTSLKVYSVAQVSEFFKVICAPANQRLDNTYSILIENFNFNVNCDNNPEDKYKLYACDEQSLFAKGDLIEKIKLSFSRNFNVYNLILKKAFFLNKQILIEIFYEFINKAAKNYNITMRFFYRDSIFIRDNAKALLKIALNIQKEIIPFFDFINDLMLYLYFNNPENYYCLNVLKALYANVASSSSEKKVYITNNFIELSELIKKNIIEVNKSNKLDITVTLCQLWITVLNVVDYLPNNDQSKIYNFIDFILEAFKSVSEPELNKNIIKLLSNLVSLNNLIDRSIIHNKYREIVYSIFGCLDNLNCVSISVVKESKNNF